MKLLDKVIEMIETKLDDPEAVEKIRKKVIAPSIGFFKEEFQRNGYDETLQQVINSVLFPMMIMLGATLVMVIVLLNLNIYYMMKMAPIVRNESASA